MYGIGRNKSSNFASDASTSSTPLRWLINGLESLSQHNPSCKRKYVSYKVTFSPLMSGDFRPRDDVPHDGADDRGERGERKVSS